METITTATPKQAPPASSLVIPTAAWFGTQRGVAQPVQLTQYDDTLPVLAVALYLNGQPYTVPDGAAVNVRMDKRDGHYVYNPAYGLSDDRKIVYVAVTLQMTTGAGEYWPILELVVDGDVAGTSVLPLYIAKNPVPEDAVESTDEWKSIQQIAAEVEEAAQVVQDNAEGIQYVQENAANITAVAQNGENISAVGENIANVNTVAENLTPIQTAATNIAAIQQAPQQAANAAASATLSKSWAVGGTGSREGEDTNNAKYYCEQAQSVTQGQLGWYATPQGLQAAHPTGQNGQWAIVGTTDTIWTWDSDTDAWVDTGSQIDLSNYYQKQEADARFQMPIGYVFEWASVPEQSVDLSTPEKVAQYFGYGRWAAFGAGQFLLGVGGSYQAGNTGGASTVSLTGPQVGPHTHGLLCRAGSGVTASNALSASAYSYVGPPGGDAIALESVVQSYGEGEPHENMPPYIVVYRWQRVA